MPGPYSGVKPKSTGLKERSVYYSSGKVVLMAEEKRGPGRPRHVEERVDLGLTESSQRALRWLMKQSGLTSKRAQVNEALEQHARALGWKGGQR